MKPKIDKTRFGSITVEGEVYRHDLLIRPDGEVLARSNELSKAVYGTSHIISLDEAKFVYEKGAEGIIIGAGQSGMVRLSEEAADYFKRKNCQVKLQPTGEAIQIWNETEGALLGLFHVTC